MRVGAIANYRTQHFGSQYFGQRRLIVFVLACIGCVLLLGSFCSVPCQARLDYEQEVGGQMLYRSFQSLRDLDGHPWQAIAFKRVFPDGQSTFFLRLVGFPEIATVARRVGKEVG